MRFTSRDGPRAQVVWVRRWSRRVGRWLVAPFWLFTLALALALALRRRVPAPGLRDVLSLLGLLLVGTGLWQVWPPSALVVCGAILLYVALRRPPPWMAGLEANAMRSERRD